MPAIPLCTPASITMPAAVITIPATKSTGKALCAVFSAFIYPMQCIRISATHTSTSTMPDTSHRYCANPLPALIMTSSSGWKCVVTTYTRPARHNKMSVRKKGLTILSVCFKQTFGFPPAIRQITAATTDNSHKTASVLLSENPPKRARIPPDMPKPASSTAKETVTASISSILFPIHTIPYVSTVIIISTTAVLFTSNPPIFS